MKKFIKHKYYTLICMIFTYMVALLPITACNSQKPKEAPPLDYKTYDDIIKLINDNNLEEIRKGIEEETIRFRNLYQDYYNGRGNLLHIIINYVTEDNIDLGKAFIEPLAKKVDLYKMLTTKNSIKNMKGEFKNISALDLAIETNNRLFIKLLVDNGLDLNKLNSEGETLLHKYWENSKTASFLIDNGFDLNKQNSKGETLLHKYWENFKIVSFLIDNGSSFTLKNNYGQTPLELIATRIDAWADWPEVDFSTLEEYDEVHKALDYILGMLIKNQALKDKFTKEFSEKIKQYECVKEFFAKKKLNIEDYI